jgi:hypothetical protein
MRAATTPIRPRARRQGVALVLTLTVLALATILVVGFAITVETEHNAARNYNHSVASRQVAQAALSDALELLRHATPPLAPDATWMVVPDAIRLNNQTILLHTTNTVLAGSGWTPWNPDTNNLNRAFVITGSNAVHQAMPTPPHSQRGGPLVFPGWVTIGTNGEPAGISGGFTNVLIARYMYWIEPESAKINITTANQRNHILGASPGDVDLTMLGLSPLVASNSWQHGIAPGYPTTESWKLATGITPTVYSNNQFYVTAHSLDHNVTPWGAAQINLNAFPVETVLESPTNNVEALQTAIEEITAMLTDSVLSNWFGQTFAGKYENPAQIAANIIDFLDTNNIPADSSEDWQDLTPPAWLGLEETPYLNELVVSNTVTITRHATGPLPRRYDFTYRTHTATELWNMYPSDYTSPTGSDQIVLLGRPSVSLTNAAGEFVHGFDLPPSITINPPAAIPAGAYQVNTFTEDPVQTFTDVNAGDGALTITFSSVTVTGIYRNARGRMDYALIPLQPVSIVTPSIASGDSWEGAVVQTAQANDPRVKPVSWNWFASTDPDTITLGAPNAVLDHSSVTNRIVGDGDISSHIIVAPDRSKGRLDSVGELGYIHTGWPWRTLRLQPQPAQEIAAPRLIPDWTVLDMFTVFSEPVRGRININSALTNVFGCTSNTLPTRLQPLAALTNAPVGYAGPDLIAISQLQFVNHPTNNFTGTPPLFPDLYTFVGQLCEVTNFVPATVSANADREARIRSMANLITTRSQTFSVWILAQVVLDKQRDGRFDWVRLVLPTALPSAENDQVGHFVDGDGDGDFAKDQPTSSSVFLHARFSEAVDEILAEIRMQIVVERYEDPSGEVNFRTKYIRYFNP